MLLNKLLYAVLTAAIASTLTATSDSPIEHAQSPRSEVINAAPKSNKRACIAIQHKAEKEESLTSVPKIPDWYYGSSVHELTFEYLNYIDLTLARGTSKAFKAMAPQVLMPTGKNWVRWYRNTFKNAKTYQQELKAFKSILSATGRRPNPIEKLKEITRNYYQDVPAALRFWNFDTETRHPHAAPDIFNDKPQIIQFKDELRTTLGRIMDHIAKLEVAQAEARRPMEQHDQPAVVAKDLAALKERQQQILAPLKEQQQKIVDLLIPSLYALAPYATANTILAEFGESDVLPDHLPIVCTRSESLDQRPLLRLAKKIAPTRGYVTTQSLGYIPLVHTILAAQPDRTSRMLKARLEDSLMKIASPTPFDPKISPDILIMNDQQDIYYYRIKINQLKQAIKNLIFKDREASRADLEQALWNHENFLNEHVLARIEDYLILLENPAQLQKDAITKHVLWLIETVLSCARASELHDCRIIAFTAYNHWSKFINSINQHERKKIINNVAYFALRVVILAADTLTSHDLRAAVFPFMAISSYYQAAIYSDQLLNEFRNDANLIDYFRDSFIQISLTSAYLRSHKHEAANCHYSKAMERLDRVQQLVSEAPIEQLKQNFPIIQGDCRTLSHITTAKNQQIAELLTKADQLTVAMSARINELEASANPQP